MKTKRFLFYAEVCLVALLLPFSIAWAAPRLKAMAAHVATRSGLQWEKSEVTEALFFYPRWSCTRGCVPFIVAGTRPEQERDQGARVFLYQKGKDISGEMANGHGDTILCQGYFATDLAACWQELNFAEGLPDNHREKVRGRVFEVTMCRAAPEQKAERCPFIRQTLQRVERENFSLYTAKNICEQ